MATEQRPINVETKQALLVAIIHHGMDLVEEEVLKQVIDLADPVERLRAIMVRKVRLVESRKEVAIILNEHQTLTAAEKRALNARKKQYVTFLEATFREAIERRQIRAVDPTVAAFSFLGVMRHV